MHGPLNVKCQICHPNDQIKNLYTVLAAVIVAPLQSCSEVSHINLNQIPSLTDKNYRYVLRLIVFNDTRSR